MKKPTFSLVFLLRLLAWFCLLAWLVAGCDFWLEFGHGDFAKMNGYTVWRGVFVLVLVLVAVIQHYASGSLRWFFNGIVKHILVQLLVFRQTCSRMRLIQDGGVHVIVGC